MGYSEQINLCMKNLSELREAFGTSVFDAAQRKFNQQRISPTRVKQKPLSPAKRMRLYASQNGKCGRCRNPIDLKGSHDDHIDSHLEGDAYNALRNRRLTCAKCNLEKGSNTVFEESKATGQPVDEILRGGRTDEDEHSYHEEDNEP